MHQTYGVFTIFVLVITYSLNQRTGAIADPNNTDPNVLHHLFASIVHIIRFARTSRTQQINIVQTPVGTDQRHSETAPPLLTKATS